MCPGTYEDRWWARARARHFFGGGILDSMMLDIWLNALSVVCQLLLMPVEMLCSISIVVEPYTLSWFWKLSRFMRWCIYDIQSLYKREPRSFRRDLLQLASLALAMYCLPIIIVFLFIVKMVDTFVLLTNTIHFLYDVCHSFGPMI